MLLVINNNMETVFNLQELQNCFDRIKQQSFAELNLEFDHVGSALTVLTNTLERKAFLVYVRNHNGDPGYSSVNTTFDQGEDYYIKFILGNGQSNDVLLSRVVPLDIAFEACEEYFEGDGRMPPIINWDDDSTPLRR